MKRVYMNVFGKGAANCLQASVASLIERDLSDLPNFSEYGKAWHQKTVAWLTSHGWGTIWVPSDAIKSLIVSDCLCIAIFDTGTHEDHAKIGLWRSWFDVQTESGEIAWRYSVDEVFDPNPYPDFECIAIRGIFLIFPMNQEVQR